MKVRVYAAGTLACLAITIGWVAGCGSKSGPTGPTGPTSREIPSLQGRVTEPGDLSVPDVRIETIGGSMSGRVATTSRAGIYQFYGVNGVTQILATKDGYQPATQNVSQNPLHADVVLTPSVPYASLGGVYSLTFAASPSCELPDDAVKRTYTATIDQRDASLKIVASNAEFGSFRQQPLNRISGRVLGNDVSFTISDTYYGAFSEGGFVEKLADNRYLTFVGVANAIATESGISAVFAGAVSVTGGEGFRPSVACTAFDHRLVFQRMAAISRTKL